MCGDGLSRFPVCVLVATATNVYLLVITSSVDDVNGNDVAVQRRIHASVVIMPMPASGRHGDSMINIAFIEPSKFVYNVVASSMFLLSSLSSS